MTTTRTVSFQIGEDQLARLDRIASETGRSRAFYLREALGSHLDEVDWAEQAIAEYEASGKQSRPAEELWAELGL